MWNKENIRVVSLLMRKLKKIWNKMWITCSLITGKRNETNVKQKIKYSSVVWFFMKNKSKYEIRSEILAV